MNPKEISRRTALKMIFFGGATILTSCRTLEDFLKQPKKPEPTLEEYLSTIEGLADLEILSSLPLLSCYQRLFIQEKRPVTKEDIGFDPLLWFHYFSQAYERSRGKREILRQEVIKILQGRTDIPKTGKEATPKLIQDLLKRAPKDYPQVIQEKLTAAFKFMDGDGCLELVKAKTGLENFIQDKKLEIKIVDFACVVSKEIKICFPMMTEFENDAEGNLVRGIIQISPVCYYLTSEALAFMLAKEYYGLVAPAKLARELQRE
ncbi:MAG: hypothetical protein ACOZBZ_04835 [Patescibacteria group bacterium]